MCSHNFSKLGQSRAVFVSVGCIGCKKPKTLSKKPRFSPLSTAGENVHFKTKVFKVFKELLGFLGFSAQRRPDWTKIDVLYHL